MTVTSTLPDGREKVRCHKCGREDTVVPPEGAGR